MLLTPIKPTYYILKHLLNPQVIHEMRDVGVMPDKRHYAMAMFACVTANQCALAESLVVLYSR
jgi:ABC-type antimicrobial peptide transport system ATPase subunit